MDYSVCQKLKKIRNFIKKQMNHINEQTIVRKRKTFVQHVLFTMCDKAVNHTGYGESLLKMKNFHTIEKNITSSSINKRVLDGRLNNYFESLNQQILTLSENHFSDKNTSKRILAVDGSQLHLSKFLRGSGFTECHLDYYTDGLISTIYDIRNRIPLFFDLSYSLNERLAFHEQYIKLETKGSIGNNILIMDRGYFSKKLVSEILQFKDDFICRLKDNMTIVTDLIKCSSDTMIINYEEHSMRLIKYDIQSIQKPYRMIINDQPGKPLKIIKNYNHYYLATSLLDSQLYPSEKIIELYHQRWSIEEFYKIFKGRLSNSTIQSVTEKSVRCELLAHHFISIITRHLTNQLHAKYDHHINYHVADSVIMNDVLPYLLFGIGGSTSTSETLLLIEECQTPIRNNRSFPRRQRFHGSKFPYNSTKEK